ncbi:MAG: cation diffusion facilitator family transporter, partial [Elusimicrobiota bacterium]
LLAEAVRRYIAGAQLESSSLGIAVMAFSLGLSIYHSRNLKRAADESGSTIMRSETLHYLTDVLSNLGVLVALGLVSYTRNVTWDLGIAAITAVYIVSEAWKILAASASELLDKGMTLQEHKDLEGLINNFDSAVIGFHDLRTRKAGSKYFIDVHVELKDSLTFRQAHDLTESLIYKIKQRFNGADVTAHYDPEGAE